MLFSLWISILLLCLSLHIFLKHLISPYFLFIFLSLSTLVNIFCLSLFHAFILFSLWILNLFLSSTCLFLYLYIFKHLIFQYFFFLFLSFFSTVYNISGTSHWKHLCRSFRPLQTFPFSFICINSSSLSLSLHVDQSCSLFRLSVSFSFLSLFQTFSLSLNVIDVKFSLSAHNE